MEVSLLLVLSAVVASGSARNPFVRHVPQEEILWDSSAKGDPGEPLFLTPYIQKGEIDQGKPDRAGEREREHQLEGWDVVLLATSCSKFCISCSRISCTSNYEHPARCYRL